MIFLSATLCVLLFQAAYAASVTNASNKVTQSQAKKTPSASAYNNVHFNNYYSGPDKEIKAELLKIGSQLTDMQKKIDILTKKKAPKKSGRYGIPLRVDFSLLPRMQIIKIKKNPNYIL